MSLGLLSHCVLCCRFSTEKLTVFYRSPKIHLGEHG